MSTPNKDKRRLAKKKAREKAVQRNQGQTRGGTGTFKIKRFGLNSLFN